MGIGYIGDIAVFVVGVVIKIRYYGCALIRIIPLRSAKIVIADFVVYRIVEILIIRLYHIKTIVYLPMC